MAWIYDLIFLAVFAFAAVASWQKGFLASLTELIGAVLGVGIAVWASRTLAPPIYDQFVSGSVSEKVETALAQSGGDLAAAVQGMDFLPETVRETLAQLVQDAGNTLPDQITTALEPVVLPFVQVLLFVVLCMVVRWVFRLLVGLLRHVNGIPLLGGVNRLFGLAMGLVTGALDCWLLALLLWFIASVTAGSLEFLTLNVLDQSVGYGIFGAFNPFLTHY
ncbi:CvpA family protein [Subdoligranulum variabile]|uniref:CvpA family protein n=1 Tax=Subdoligranulum variabile TaxID=214851 RepID=UPI0026EE0D90|nr:CvpA family protein [Subdoligranulum variabile]